MSWLLFAVGSAFFAGITAILAKIGIQSVPSHLATALRTGVVLVFAWGMVFLVGSQGDLAQLTGGDLAWLVLSGLATGASWLCYFRALQLGDVNKVTPIDKSSTVLTILLAWLLLGEPLSLPQGLGVVAIGAGTLLMITRKEGAAGQPHDRRWLLYALGSGGVCQPHRPLWQVGGGEHRVQPGHRHPHHCGAGHGLGDGLSHRGAEGPAPGGPAERDLPGALGAGHWGLLAVLFPGPAGRAGQRGGAH